MEKKNLLVTFSGGETSGYMAKWLLDNKSDDYNMIFIFANTSQENEDTLRFADLCDKAFGMNLVWIEAVVNFEKGKGTKAIVTDFTNAKRNGEVFEDVIKKYGFTSPKSPVCTRELKSYAIRNYARSIGWKNNTYELAIGIRADEFDRVASNRKNERLLYPLIELTEKTKKDVNEFWRDMPFRLNIKGYEGNCMTCFKKSFRKLATIAMENPKRFDFFREMEIKYSRYTPVGKKLPKDKWNFFRGNKTVDDIFAMVNDPNFKPATDDKIIYRELTDGTQLDISFGCSESCEAF